VCVEERSCGGRGKGRGGAASAEEASGVTEVEEVRGQERVDLVSKRRVIRSDRKVEDGHEAHDRGEQVERGGQGAVGVQRRGGGSRGGRGREELLERINLTELLKIQDQGERRERFQG
jgi:hypothetical protein